ncbi:hypothetical protein DYB32_009483, partial [Aphanomyces invadans]
MERDAPTIHAAMEAVRSKRMSTRSAACHFGVGRMMLQRRISGTVKLTSRNGRDPKLTAGEELGIVEAVNERTLHAQCFTMTELADFIRVCIENSQYTRVVPDTFPSVTYVKTFIKRHAAQFSTRSAQAMEAVRAKRSTVEVVEAHYANIAKVLEDNNVEPDCIWNLDETGASAQGSHN